MNRAQLVALAVCLVAPMLSGCATMASGPQQLVTFDSDPPGARVLLDGLEIGRTPFSASISRWRSPVITYRLKGYKAETGKLRSLPNEYVLLDLPWFFLFVFPGAIAVGVDILTGAIFKFEPSSVHMTLEPLEPRLVRAGGNAVGSSVRRQRTGNREQGTANVGYLAAFR
ncbi:PEGA domain-containing protein [Planctomycetota bacterium]